MADEPTLGELGRRLDDRIGDVRDDIAQLGRRIDGKVAADVYQIQHDAMNREITALRAEIATMRTQRQQDADRLATTRRWLIGAIIVPLLTVLLPLLITHVGGTG